MNSSYLHVLNRICEEVQQEMANKLKDDNEIEWTVKVELIFLYAMIGCKPVGVNKHFMMLLIHHKFSAFLNHQLSSKVLWDHLDSMYDMAALHESEIIPFPNDEVDFELPDDCLELLESKHGVALKKSSNDSETNKNSSNSKNAKKLAPKLKQSSVPIVTPKSTFASPVPSKPVKNQVAAKSEVKVTNSDTPKSKQELGIAAKMNKVKRSSSPSSVKSVKSESASVVKEDSPDIPSNKKNVKVERGASPATVKKTIKVETSTPSSSSKKPSKSESSANGSKPEKAAKTEVADNSAKKAKVEKETPSKKSRTASPAVEVSTKKVKADVNGVKKKADETPKKTSESQPAKQAKSEAKSSSQSRGLERETPPPSGSRKSSPVVKVVKSNDSNKKLKRPRTEDTSKKAQPTPKRRRL